MTNDVRVVVEALHIYPIKSCAPVSVECLDFDAEGRLLGDREWAVVDESSSIVWQGSHPGLAQVRPEFHGEHAALRNTRGDYVCFEPESMSIQRDVHIWNDTAKRNEVFTARDAGDDVAAFLERTVGARLRLVRLGAAALRREGLNRLHLVSRASFEELAEDLPLSARLPADLMRFRPNIIITDCEEPLVPFLEEQFSKLEWIEQGTQAVLEVGERCVRCVVPNVDPLTAKADASVMGAVAKHSASRYPGEPIYFGLYAASKGPCTLKLGTTLDASLGM